MAKYSFEFKNKVVMAYLKAERKYWIMQKMHFRFHLLRQMLEGIIIYRNCKCLEAILCWMKFCFSNCVYLDCSVIG